MFMYRRKMFDSRLSNQMKEPIIDHRDLLFTKANNSRIVTLFLTSSSLCSIGPYFKLNNIQCV